MTLSEHEQQVFQEIERHFRAERDRTARRNRRPDRTVLVLTGCWVVSVLLLTALLTGIWLMGATAAVVVAAIVCRPLARGGRDRSGG